MENKVVTIKDVAKKAGVSVSTVSRAMNKYSDISNETREHILKIADEMGYKPNVVARSLSSSRNFRLGIIIEDYEPSSIYNPLVFEILMAFKNTATKLGYETVLLSTNSDIQKGQSIAKLFAEKQIDGAFLMGLKLTDDYYKELEKIQYPCVVFDAMVKNPSICCVGVNNIRGAFLATEHLINLGHRKIAFINGHKEAFVSYERLDGYYLALNRYGIDIDKDLIFYSDFTDKGAEMVVQQLVKSRSDVTAIFCASDLMAIGAINMLNNLGYTIPTDISIVGFDDIYFAQYISPKLTTIRQDRDKIGETVANVLINLSLGQRMERVLIEPEIVIRESTAHV